MLGTQTVWAQLARIGEEELEDESYRPSGLVTELKIANAKDQGSAEECFLFAYVSELETSIQNSSRIASKPTLSVPYLLGRKIQSYVHQTFDHGETTFALRGGQIYDAIHLAHYYGVVPEKSWKPKVPYTLWDTEALYEGVSKNVRNWKAKLERVESSEGKKSDAYKSEIRKAKYHTLKDLYALIGSFPQNVEFEGKTYTPKQLTKRFGSDRRTDIRMMYPPSKWNDESVKYFVQQLNQITKTMQGSYEVSSATSWQETVKQIQTNVDAGQATLIGISWGRGSGHIMTVIGYEMNETGEITHLKALNSWGEVWGENGAAWFQAKDISKKYDQIWWFQFQPGALQTDF